MLVSGFIYHYHHYRRNEKEMTHKYELHGGDYISDFKLFPEQAMDVWFCDGFGESFVGTFTKNNRFIHIYCLGEMRVNLADGSVWRSSWDIPVEITNDNQLMAILQDPATNVVNNCWLELIEDGESTEIICGNIFEAIEEASKYLSEVRV